jgi:hypothetical protein
MDTARSSTNATRFIPVGTATARTLFGSVATRPRGIGPRGRVSSLASIAHATGESCCRGGTRRPRTRGRVSTVDQSYVHRPLLPMALTVRPEHHPRVSGRQSMPRRAGAAPNSGGNTPNVLCVC